MDSLSFVCSYTPENTDIGIILHVSGVYCEILWNTGHVTFCNLSNLIVLSEIDI